MNIFGVESFGFRGILHWIFHMCKVAGGSVKMWNFKIEEGTKATDWSPAPEDVQADMALAPRKEEIKAGISITTGGINVFGRISLAGKVTLPRSTPRKRLSTARRQRPR